MSQNDKSHDGWSVLAEMIEPKGISCLDIKWESISYGDLGLSLASALGSLILDGSIGLILPGGKIPGLIKGAVSLFHGKMILIG